MKYYFVYFHYRKATCSNNGPWNNEEGEDQFLINEHPLKWQIAFNEKYAREPIKTPQYSYNEYYKVINWKEITEEEYLEFKDEIN